MLKNNLIRKSLNILQISNFSNFNKLLDNFEERNREIEIDVFDSMKALPKLKQETIKSVVLKTIKYTTEVLEKVNINKSGEVDLNSLKSINNISEIFSLEYPPLVFFSGKYKNLGAYCSPSDFENFFKQFMAIKGFEEVERRGVSNRVCSLFLLPFFSYFSCKDGSKTYYNCSNVLSLSDLKKQQLIKRNQRLTIKEILELNKYLFMFYYLRGSSLSFYLNQDESALLDLNISCQLNKNFPFSFYNRAKILIGLQPEKYLETWEDKNKAVDENTKIMLKLSALYQKRTFEEVEKEYTPLTKLPSLKNIIDAENDINISLKLFNQMEIKQNNYMDIYLYKAISMAVLKKFDKSLENYQIYFNHFKQNSKFNNIKNFEKFMQILSKNINKQ